MACSLFFSGEFKREIFQYESGRVMSFFRWISTIHSIGNQRLLLDGFGTWISSSDLDLDVYDFAGLGADFDSFFI
ncbi:hypothetical protein RCL_jg296.t1 [Rhizophagus clarus]|uniref:Uncharacterized protein n=1 Tax=Rhizophagus clarus TaxID=94130 RepID=A0A8H3M1H7_9GLOM|nr:hypothetical protein RCL_jg296.t1 [Rhizophagus clarus]